MSASTYANGIEIRPRGFDSQPARKLAAAFDRGGPASAEYIKCNKLYPPTLRVDSTPDETFSVTAPDGWQIRGVCVTDGGATYVRFKRDD